MTKPGHIQAVDEAFGPEGPGPFPPTYRTEGGSTRPVIHSEEAAIDMHAGDNARYGDVAMPGGNILERRAQLQAADLRARADAICRRQPGYGTPSYRGDPYEAVALYQRADQLDGGADPDICPKCGRDYRGEPLAPGERCLCETEGEGL